MSTTIDQRVVEMRFDNQHFEKNVSNTMSTLDKLKQKLNLSGASKGLEDVNSAAKKVDMSGLGKGVEAVSMKFSALQVMGVTALANITNSAVNAGKRIASALTIDPIKTGFQEYETQINSTQTILANTASKGSTIEDVNKALEELNTYADKTIYNFTEMTRNIGTFTAAGIDLDTSVNAIQGIANLAAVSGSTSQQASTAMYQLSQALAAGTVKLMDWNSVVNAGMGGEMFQTALKETSKLLGTGAEAAIEATGSFRESLREGWLTSEVLTETLKKFTTSGANEYIAEYTGLTREAVDAEVERAQKTYEGAEAIDQAAESLAKLSGKSKEEIKNALEFAQNAEDAATKVKTFTQLWDVMKESAQSGWSQTWKILIGDFEEAKSLLTPLADFLTGAINKMSEARNKLLESALGKSFTSLAEKLKNIVDPIKKTADSVKGVADSLKDYATIVDEIIGGSWGNGQARWDKLAEAGYDWAHAQNLVNEKLGDATRHATDYSEAQNGVAEAQEKSTETATELTNADKKTLIMLADLNDEQLRAKNLTEEQIAAVHELQDMADKLGISVYDLINNIDTIDGRWLLIESFKNAGKGLVTIFNSIGEAWRKAFHGDASDEEILEKRSNALFNIIAAVHKFSTKLVVSEETAKNVTRTFKGLFAILDIISTIAGGALKTGFTILTKILGAFDMNIWELTGNIGDAIVGFRDWLFETNALARGIDWLIDRIPGAIKVVKGWIDAFVELPAIQTFVSTINGLVEAFKGLTSLEFGSDAFYDALYNIGEFIGDAFKHIPDIMSEIGSNIVDGLKNGLGDGVSGIFDKIKEIGNSIITIICGILGIHSPSTVFIAIGGFIIAGLVAGLKEGIIAVPEAFQGIFDKCVAIIQNIDWGAIFAVGVSIAALTFVKKIGDALEAFSAPFAGLGDIFESVSDVVESFGKVTNAVALNIKTKALKQLAIALAILAGTIIALTFFDPVDLLKSVGILILLAGVLVVLAWAVNKMSDASVEIGKDGAKLNGLKTSLMSIAAAVAILAIAVKLVGSMHWTEALQGFIGLAGIMTAIVAFMWACGKVVSNKGRKNVDQISGVMIKLAIAIGLMVGVAKLAGKLSEDEMLKGAAFAAAFLIFIGALNLVTQKSNKNISKLGGTMIKLAFAMGLMVGVVKLIDFLEPAEMGKGVLFAIAFVSFVKSLVKATKIGKEDQIAKLGGLLLAISFSMALMVGVCKLVGRLSGEEMLKGALFAAGFVVMVKAFMKILTIGKEEQIAKVAGTVLMMSVAIGVMAGVAMMLSLLDLADLAKGITAVGILGSVLALMIHATKGASDVKGNLIVMSVAIAVMAAAVAGLSFIKIEKLVPAVLAMSMLMGMFALMTKSAKGLEKGMGTLIVMTAAIAVMAGVLWLLSTLEVKACLENAAAMSLLLLAVSGAMLIVSKIGDKTIKESLKSILSLTLMAIPLLAFSIVLRQMNGIESSTKNVLTLIGLMGVMTRLLAILAVIGKLAGFKSLIGVLGLTAMVGPMAAFIAMLSWMSGIDGAATNAKAIAGLMATMTGLLVVLTAIGAIVIATGGVAAGAIVIGVVALAAMVGPMAAFIAMLSWMSGIDGAATNANLLIGLMTIMTGLLTHLAIIGPFAMIGVVALAGLVALMGAVGILAVAIGDLMDKRPELEEFLNKGMGILVQIAEGLGTVLGKFIVAFTSQVMTILPNLGLCLSLFWLNAQPFIVGVSSLPDGLLENVLKLTGAILALSAASFIEGVMSIFGLGLADLGSDLQRFALSIIPFVATLMMIDPGAIDAANTLAKLILALSGAEFIQGITNLVSKVFKTDEMDTIADKLVAFAGAMSKFSTAIKADGGIDVAAIESASKAGLLMVELEKSLPKSDGWWQSIAGEQDLSTFGAKCVAFGASMIAFSKSIVAAGGIDVNAIEAAADAGSLMSELQDSLPKTGGKWSTVAGEQDLSTFGAKCVAFGASMIAFSKSIVAAGGIDVNAIEAAADAGSLMSELQDSLPKTGGAWQNVAGEQDIATFGASCKAFGEALTMFPSDISISEETIASAKSAGEMMLELQDSLPKTGGAWQDVAGEKDIEAFASSTKTFAQAMRTFSSNFTITEDTINSVKNAGEMMIELQELLPKSGGILHNIAGESDISAFATSCKTFSEALTGFANNPISEDTITSVQNAGEMLVGLQEAIVESSGFDDGVDLGVFGEKIKTFYASLKEFATDGISEEAFTSADTAGRMMIKLQEAIPESTWFDGKVELDDFGKKIKKFGGYLVDYSDKVSGIDATLISASITQARRIVNFASSLVDFDPSGIDNFKVKKLGKAIGDYADKVSEMDVSVVSGSITIARRLISLINSMVGLDNSGVDSFSVKSIGSKLKSYSDSVSEIDYTTLSSSISAAYRLKNFVASLVGLDTSGVDSFKTAISSLGKINVNTFATTFNSFATGLASVGSTMVDSLIKGINSRQPTLLMHTRNMVDAMSKAIRGRQLVFSVLGVQIMTGFIQGINSKRSSLIMVIASSIISALTSIHAYYWSFYSAGSYLVDGFADGISASSWKAEAEAAAMASAAYEAAKEALDVNSPSKVFRKLGYSIPEGLAMGIDKLSGMAGNSAVSMADEAINTVKNSISRIGDAINSDIDSQPTIRPVLDLSDVRSGANSISSMLGFGTSVGVMANVGAISSAMNQNGNNMSNSDIVSAIKDLKNTIGNSSGDVYNFDGISYDDGSNISNAVKDIIRAAKVQRRI